jgi:hypothetical protein
MAPAIPNVTIRHDLLPISAPLSSHVEHSSGNCSELQKKIPWRVNMTLKSETPERRKGEDLDNRYGKIGIPAVAAALPYRSDAKNQAYAAPVVHRDDALRSQDAWRAEMTA